VRALGIGYGTLLPPVRPPPGPVGLVPPAVALGRAAGRRLGRRALVAAGGVG
jgi:hypothetical protein